ncbi:MAG: hypothetical protein ACRCVX_14300 [Shewanella sp.]
MAISKNGNSARFERIHLSTIKPNSANPRLIKDAGYASLKKSIAQFPEMLFARPLAVRSGEDLSYHVLGGNQRYRCLCDLQKEVDAESFAALYDSGEKQRQTLIDIFANGVPSVNCDNFTDQESRRFIVADNVSAGDWDTEGLSSWYESDELIEWGVPNWVVGGVDNIIEKDGFNLPEGDKEPFQQMSFVFSDKQAVEVKTLISLAATDPEFSSVQTDGNKNESGNAIYFMLNQWAQQSKSL